MAYYIRKAFKSGPVRINLSKGGVGLSLGVTGARVGLNSRGAYVHAGRNGLYYRKQLARRASGSTRSLRTDTTSTRSDSVVNQFRDTGITLGLPYWKKYPAAELKQWQKPPLFTNNMKVILGVSALFMLGGMILQATWLAMINAVIAGVTLALGIRSRMAQSEADAIIDRLSESLDAVADSTTDDTKVIEDILIQSSTRLPLLPDVWKAFVAAEIHLLTTSAAISSQALNLTGILKSLDTHFPIIDWVTQNIRKTLLEEALDDVLSDHVLTAEEELAMLKLMEESGLGPNPLKRNMDVINHYRELRSKLERPLLPITTKTSLVRGEKAFEAFEVVRILNERVLERFQRNSVQYRVTGYELDIEGEAVITDRRVIISGNATREYRINVIEDITVDPEAGIIELSMRERKSPVILTTEEPVLFATRLEMIREAGSND